MMKQHRVDDLFLHEGQKLFSFQDSKMLCDEVRQRKKKKHLQAHSAIKTTQDKRSINFREGRKDQYSTTE